MQEGFHLLFEARADTAHLRFGNAAGSAQRLHQAADLPGVGAAGVGLHHHGIEGLDAPAARLKPVREKAALAQFGDGQAEIAHLGQPLAVPSVGGALIRAALMTRGPRGAITGNGHGLCSIWW